MRVQSVLLVLILAAPALAGCVTHSGSVDTAAPSPATATLIPDLSDLDASAIDAERGRLWWEHFVSETPYRHAGSPTNHKAADLLMEELEAYGYDVHVYYYVPPAGTPSPLSEGVRAIVGTKPGQVEPDHAITWVAHYDTQQATVYGAYDDGSGTAVAMELARVLSQYDNRKTLMPIFFDAEEVGLLASQYYLEHSIPDDITFDLVIGHDMTGINCPGHDWRMWQFVGEKYVADIRPILEELYATQLTPEEAECIAFHDEVIRNSDERRFHDAGYPTIRMAGGFLASDYPAYHKPNDTVEFIYAFTDGVENYEKGFELTVRTSYWAAVAFDRLPSITRAT